MRTGILVLLACLAGAPARPQAVISAKAGLVYRTEGPTFLNMQPVPRRFGFFPQMKDGDKFRTGLGRAEILLAPGVFLRLGGRTLIRLVSDRIMHAKVELLSGRAVLDAASLKKTETVALDLPGATVTISQRGVYHLETNPPALRVFKGKLVVVSGGRRIEVTKGQELLLDGTWIARKFDRHKADDLDTWSDGRSKELSLANTLTMWSNSASNDPFEFSAADSGQDIKMPGSGRTASQSSPSDDSGSNP